MIPVKRHTITTERLSLHAFDPASYHEIFTTCTDEEITCILGLQSAEELQEEKCRFQKGIATHNRSFVNFQIRTAGTNEMLGWCGFHTWYTQHERAEIGYALRHEQHMGKGIMTEALNAIVRYGFEVMNLNRIEAFIGPGNTASVKLVKQAGFKKEGLLREHYFKNGRHEDSVVFSLLKGEWLHNEFVRNQAL
ncbi:GNAT family N-acetyltransferase [Chitinophagaceae bacterium MMS25-I14]